MPCDPEIEIREIYEVGDLAITSPELLDDVAARVSGGNANGVGFESEIDLTLDIAHVILVIGNDERARLFLIVNPFELYHDSYVMAWSDVSITRFENRTMPRLFPLI